MTAARAFAVVGLAALAACTVGPNYRRPDVPVPPAFSELDTAAGLPASDADLARWWLQFHDPVLQSLIERALANNLDLEAAASRIRQARFEESVAKTGQWPAVSATGGAVTLNSDRSSGGAPAQGLELPGHLNLYTAGFDATWELDLFGGVRRRIEAARANSEAAVWDRRDGEVSLTAEVAADYLTLREVQTRIAIGEAELARQKDIGGLIAARRQAGFLTNLDVNQQTGATTAAAAQLRQLEAEARTQIHAIAVLLGEPPETLEPTLAPALAPGVAEAPPPPELPAGLPSDLLRRRPDIREAERKLAAANAEIGVQTAGLYPKLDLIGLASFAAPTLGNLFSSQSFTSAAGGLVTAPLFTAGKTRAQIGEAKEQAAQAGIAYRSAILGALRDTEDALARYRAETARRAQLAKAVDAADNSLTIARDQYRVGLVTFLNVYVAENTLLNARDQLAQSDAEAAEDLVSLYKALGGGWAAT